MAFGVIFGQVFVASQRSRRLRGRPRFPFKPVFDRRNFAIAAGGLVGIPVVLGTAAWLLGEGPFWLLGGIAVFGVVIFKVQFTTGTATADDTTLYIPGFWNG